MATNFTNNNISSIKYEEIKYNLKSIPFHATEAEWLTINYTPKQAEWIIYDKDENYNYPRFKTGDGITNVNNLPFIPLVTPVELQEALNSAGHLKRVVLELGQELPSVEDAEEDVIYMVPASLVERDSYEEYMLINGQWEIIGNTKVDLSEYLKEAVLSVSAGQGLKITGTPTKHPVIEIDNDVVFVIYGGNAIDDLFD